VFDTDHLKDTKLPAGVAITANITEFRLGSSAGKFWVGAMAGADQVKVDVLVQEGEAEKKRFTVFRTTTRGISGSKRIKLLSNVIAKDIRFHLNNLYSGETPKEKDKQEEI
jgi:hypothetical protein